ncbi:hypothetical protein QBC44DRAFT_28296 [Cladorrhinum sp. PSN332]|nr:hypothetical protein QBC44DRAFT_28296 [Cladorrhinum sp. PSN332]
MVRQLPWKLNGATRNNSKDQRPKKVDARSSGRTATSSSRSPAPPHRRNRRSPSTSPAPEPLKEEFMIEGGDHDDKYRMVEDEFLDVAGQFTKHLHAAEYQRLKNLAKSQNAETIQTISRPVAGEMTDLVRRRHAALDTASKQRRGIARLAKRTAASPNDDSNTDEEELPRQPTTCLRGLMDSPRKRVTPLKSFSSIVRSSSFREPPFSTTATAVTIKRETPAQSASDPDSDDLDSKPRWRSKCKESIRGPAEGQSLSPQQLPAKTVSSQEPRVPFVQPPQQPPVVKEEPLDDGDPFAALRARRVRRLQSTTEHQKKTDDSDDDDDPFARSRARKRARETKAQQQQDTRTSESQKTALHEIPSFM